MYYEEFNRLGHLFSAGATIEAILVTDAIASYIVSKFCVPESQCSSLRAGVEWDNVVWTTIRWQATISTYEQKLHSAYVSPIVFDYFLMFGISQHIYELQHEDGCSPEDPLPMVVTGAHFECLQIKTACI